MDPADAGRDLWSAARELLGADVLPVRDDPSGETFLVAMAGDLGVLRLYVADPHRAGVDLSLARLVRGLVPVPDVLDWRPPSADGLGAFVLTAMPAGTRLDRVLATADVDLQRVLGMSVGSVLARLSGIPFLAPGTFRGPELALEMDSRPVDLEAWVGDRLRRPPLEEWPVDVRRGLAAAAAAGAHHLDGVDRTCLVHGAFDGRHLLADPETGAVTGLLDWSRAHAGTPVTDLGTLLRDVGLGPFTDAVEASFRAGAPPLPAFLRETAAAADLFVLVELATRDLDHPVVNEARTSLRTIGARARD